MKHGPLSARPRKSSDSPGPSRVDPKRDINLEKIKKLKNTIYIPTIPSATNRVENDYSKLKNWDYWCIELNLQIVDAEYLSSWFNQKVPKMLLMNLSTSGSFMRRINSKDFENVHIFKHSLEQQRKFKENLETVDKIVAKAEKLRMDNVFDPITYKKLSMREAIENLCNFIERTIISLGSEKYIKIIKEILDKGTGTTRQRELCNNSNNFKYMLQSLKETFHQ